MYEENDFHWDDEDELKWLQKMKRSGKLNDTGKRNLAEALNLKSLRESD